MPSGAISALAAPDLSVHTARDLERIEAERNRRPRIVLDDWTPEELFRALLRPLPRHRRDPSSDHDLRRRQSSA